MTDAPEKVFAWPSADGRGWYAGGCSYEPTMTFEDIEYIRADLVDEQDAAWAERVAALEAAVAAARAEGMREAARIADRHYAAGDMGNPGHHILTALEASK